MPSVDVFTVNQDILIRSVTPARGTPYQHTCDKDVYESVAHAIDELNGASFTGEEIRQSIQAPFTQVFVALAFLRERSCIVPAHRQKSVAATNDTYLDAMIEWHALREKPHELDSEQPHIG